MSMVPVAFDLKDVIPIPPTDLPSEDNDNMETPWHRSQMELLITCTEHRWRGRRDFFCGGNMFVHFSAERARNQDFRGPDFFVVLDVDHDRERAYWATWEEDGRTPDVIVELLSPRTAETDRTTKRDVYERTLRTSEYFLYDPATQELEGFRLAGRYRRIEPDERGRLWSEELGCWLGTWEGEFDHHRNVWLRFFEPDGLLVPTGVEYHAEQSARFAARADTEAARANSAETELARLKAEIAALKSPPPTTPPTP